VAYVEKTDVNPNGYTVDQAISVIMKNTRRPFIFAQLPDRGFVVEKIADMLAKLVVRKYTRINANSCRNLVNFSLSEPAVPDVFRIWP
jgi:hypothetical protein